MLCARNLKFKIEVLVIMKLLRVKRHDSIYFIHNVDEFGRDILSVSSRNIRLDSAHDNIFAYIFWGTGFNILWKELFPRRSTPAFLWINKAVLPA